MVTAHWSTPTPRPRAGLALLASIAVGGCGAATDSGEPTVRRDSAGIAIVENRVDPAEVPDWTVDPTPNVRIGVVEGDPAYQLFRVWSAVRLSDGRIVVVNGGTNELRWYDPAGSHLFSRGGSGEGPGEYRGLRWIRRFAGDSIWAGDGLNPRIALYSPSGELVETRRTDAVGPYGAPTPIGGLPDGRLVALSSESRREPPGLIDFDGLVVAYSPRGETMDTLVRTDGGRRFLQRCGPDLGWQCNRFIPFATSMHGTAGGGRIFAGNGRPFEIEVYDPAGELRELWRVPGPLRSVTAGALDREREAFLGRYADEDARRRAARRWEETPKPETVPAYSALLADAAGNLWVELYRGFADPAATDYLVFSPEGEAVGRVALPPGLEPTDVGDDYVLGTRRDETDVEFVQLHALSK